MVGREVCSKRPFDATEAGLKRPQLLKMGKNALRDLAAGARSDLGYSYSTKPQRAVFSYAMEIC
jgi:hypothetical protein